MSNQVDELHLSRTPAHLRRYATIPLVLCVGAGLLALLPALGVKVDAKVGDLEREQAERVGVCLAAAISLTCGAVGVFMFSRWETVIDRRRRTVIRRWNLLGWQRLDRWPLDGVTHVELRFQDRVVGQAVTYEAGKREAPTHRYFVVLCGDRVDIPVVQPLSETVSRREAQRVATFLGLELHHREIPLR